MQPILTTAQAITADWLTDCLRQRGDLQQGIVQSLTVGETTETTSSLVTSIQVTYSAEASTTNQTVPPTNLIYKTARSGWYWAIWAETVLYDEIAAEMTEAPVPRCFYTVADQQHKVCGVLLEDISATHERLPYPTPADRPTGAELEQVVDALLKFHVHYWNHPYLEEKLVHEQGGPLVMAHAALPEVVQLYSQQMREAYPQIVAEVGSDLKPEWHIICQKAIEYWPQLMLNRIQRGKGLTMIHGDFHLWNLFFPLAATGGQPLILDWETFRRGFGPYDLAYLLISGDDIALRRHWERPLLKRYHDGLLAGGIKHYSWEDCVADYRLGVIANLFPPLNWRRIEALAAVMAAFEEWECATILAG